MSIRSPLAAAIVRISMWALVLWLGLPAVMAGLIKMFGIDWATTGWGDCRVDWGAARLFLEHKSPYTEEGLATMNLQSYGFGHPPTTSFWFLPFAKVGYPLMSQIVGVLTLVALLFHVIICARELQLPAKAAIVLLSFGFLIRTTWMEDHVIIVQVSEFIAFLMVIAWYFLRRNREVEAGISLGLACTLKLFPGVLVLFLLLTRRFRGFVAACLAYLSIAAIMTSGYGWSAWSEFFKQQGPIASFWVGHVRNASLYGIVARLFRPLCDRPNDEPFVLQIIGELRKLPSVPPIPGARWAAFAALALLAGCWWIARRDARHAYTLDIPYALFCVVSTFVNPWIWEHYNVVLIMPTFVLLAAIVERGRRLRSAFAASSETLRALVVEFVLLGLAFVSIVALLAVDIRFKTTLYGRYWALHGTDDPMLGDAHRRMHFFEVLNWLPWAIMILTLGALQLSRRKSEREDSNVKGRQIRQDEIRDLRLGGEGSAAAP